MEKVIVIYKSNTGFTQKYAEWIGEELKCKVISIKNVDFNDLENYNTIIYGGGLYAGQINGLKVIKNKLTKIKDKNKIVFVTGAASQEGIKIDVIENTNFSSEEKEGIHLFYFRSGINYEKMGVGSKLLMGIFKTMLKMTKNKSPENQAAYDSIKNSNDYSKKEYINPVIDYVKMINK